MVCQAKTTIGQQPATVTVSADTNGTVGEIIAVFAQPMDDHAFMDLRAELIKTFGEPTVSYKFTRAAEWKSTDGAHMLMGKAEDGAVFINMSNDIGAKISAARDRARQQQKPAGDD